MPFEFSGIFVPSLRQQGQQCCEEQDTSPAKAPDDIQSNKAESSAANVFLTRMRRL
ncbi:MAG: hypothetical protein ABR953_14000 [Candidatus Acidiferrales bacterium]